MKDDIREYFARLSPAILRRKYGLSEYQIHDIKEFAGGDIIVKSVVELGDDGQLKSVRR